jgi:hypothetical protein
MMAKITPQEAEMNAETDLHGPARWAGPAFASV